MVTDDNTRASLRRSRGRAALVTGGGTGIGLGCAKRLAADGAIVTICGRRRDALAAAAAEIGERGRFVVCDVQDEDQVAAAVAAAAEPLGGLHITVVNAGGGLTAGPIVTGDVAGWRSQLDVNVIGSFLTIKHAAPVIARSGGGSIVAISSIAGSHTHRHLAAYSVSKAALDMLVRNAADELGEFGVRVNAVRPGLVPTDASQPLDADPGRAPTTSRRCRSAHRHRRRHRRCGALPGRRRGLVDHRPVVRRRRRAQPAPRSGPGRADRGDVPPDGRVDDAWRHE